MSGLSQSAILAAPRPAHPGVLYGVRDKAMPESNDASQGRATRPLAATRAKFEAGELKAEIKAVPSRLQRLKGR